MPAAVFCGGQCGGGDGSAEAEEEAAAVDAAVAMVTVVEAEGAEAEGDGTRVIVEEVAGREGNRKGGVAGVYKL